MPSSSRSSRDRTRRETETAVSRLRASFGTLTPRELEVMTLVTAGLMNKQIAAELGVSEITVKVHRGHVTRKMGARSLADLVRMADVLGIRKSGQDRLIPRYGYSAMARSLCSLPARRFTVDSR